MVADEKVKLNIEVSSYDLILSLPHGMILVINRMKTEMIHRGL